MLKTLPGTIIIDVETLSVPATKISLSYGTWIKKTRPCDILSVFLSVSLVKTSTCFVMML